MAVSWYIHNGLNHQKRQLFPGEDASNFFSNNKVTSDLAEPVRFKQGLTQAKQHLITMRKQHWTLGQFNETDWHHLNAKLENKLDVYIIWLSKQHTGICGTREQMAYYANNINGDMSCPNCPNKEALGDI